MLDTSNMVHTNNKVQTLATGYEQERGQRQCLLQGAGPNVKEATGD